MTQHTNSQHNYNIARETMVLNASKKSVQNPILVQPSIYNKDGKIDITERRNAVKARVQASNVAQTIWDVRMGGV